LREPLLPQLVSVVVIACCWSGSRACAGGWHEGWSRGRANTAPNRRKTKRAVAQATR
jgi:hypothetical protein